MFDLKLIKSFYEQLDKNISNVKSKISKPLTLTEKILYAHADGEIAKEFFETCKIM